MKIHDLPQRVQLALQSALDELPEDRFAETIERDETSLIVGVSSPGDNAITGYLRLAFDQESETYVVQTKVS